MRKAYDTFLQTNVSAVLAAKAGNFEPYRFECAHCGEEVQLAAVDSISIVPHFRHRSGNSDIECEYYLGQHGAFSTDTLSRKSKNERAEFYFDSNTKMFYLGLRLSEDEIFAHEQRSTTFELRTAPQAQAFYSLHINRKNFNPDVQRIIPIENFSHDYFLSNTLNSLKRKYEVFKNTGNSIPTFFKMQVGDRNYKAKLVRSFILYTNISYFVFYQSQYWIPININLPHEIKIESTFNFETMGRKFLGMILTITSKNSQIDSLLLSWGYQLEASETLTLLWPPAPFVEESVLINAEFVFLFSTFELQAHGNINVRSEDIKKIDVGISKVSVNSRTKVYKKNAELMLEKCKQTSDTYTTITLARKVLKTYNVLDDSTFLFNRSGVSHLSTGMSILLTPESEIRHFTFGYLDGCVSPASNDVLEGDLLLQDVLIHYKRKEAFKWDDYDSLELSQTAFLYLEYCEKTGRINSVAKQFIEEGRI